MICLFLENVEMDVDQEIADAFGKMEEYAF